MSSLQSVAVRYFIMFTATPGIKCALLGSIKVSDASVVILEGIEIASETSLVMIHPCKHVLRLDSKR